MKRIVATMFFLSNMFTGVYAHAQKSKIGGSDGGGGYSYYYTSVKHIELNANFIIDRIILLTESQKSQFKVACKNYLLSEAFAFIKDFPAPPNLQACDKLDLAKLKGILFNITIDVDPANQPYKHSPAGQLEPLSISYSPLNGGMLKAHRPLLDRMNRTTLTSEEAEDLKRILIHEASHLMGIGVKHDIDSYIVSAAVNSFLNNPTSFLETWGIQ